MKFAIVLGALVAALIEHCIPPDNDSLNAAVFFIALVGLLIVGWPTIRKFLCS